MATTCVYISIYCRISAGVGNESFCTIQSFPYADLADADAIRCIWHTDSENKWEDEEVVADGISGGGACLLGVDLV